MKTVTSQLEQYGLHHLTQRWIEKAVATSFFPERARVNFERFLEKIIETDKSLFSQLNKRNIPVITTLFSGSQALTDLALNVPASLFWALQPSVLYSTRFKREMRGEMEASLRKIPGDPKAALCYSKNRELLRIGWRDLLKWADTVETLEDLSRLADVTIEGAMKIAEKEMEDRFGRPIHEDGTLARFIVVGLGKLGGRELNFSSDIDLIYLYDSDDGETEGGKGSHHRERKKISIPEFYTRMAQRLTSLLNDIGPQGNLYRVDLNLRPEGTRGPIVNSLASADLYYESWGQQWERQMLIKARICAGSESLGDIFLKRMKPFVSSKNLDFTLLKEIQQMKGKIDKHLKTGKDSYKNNVKLGKGGIREIEFIIQTYQLIYGGKMPWLSETNSLKALHRVFERGLLGNVQYAQLADALLFLRDLENRMQITYGRQVQIIPHNEDELNALALKMNFTNSEELMKEYKRITENVHDIFTEFFKEEEKEEEPQSEYQVDLDNEEESIEQLTKWKFNNPRKTFDALLHIRDGEPFNHPSSKSRRMFTRLVPRLMELLVKNSDKDRAVINLDLFFSTQPEREGLYEILLELPSSAEVLTTLFSLSQYLTDIMINQPGSVEILASGFSVKPKHSLLDIPVTIESYDTKLAWLRRVRNAESLRIGIGYLVSHKNPFEMMEQLTMLADEFVQACISVVGEEVYGDSGLIKFAVIGMGKQGRRELNFGSDLDLMFVYSEEEHGSQEATAMFFGFCQKLLNAIGGFSKYGSAYRIDTRLRPEGEKGSIAITDNAATTYYAKRGALWERMALCGARVVAGDVEFGNGLLNKLDPFIYGSGLSDKELESIHAMKSKMERERIKASKGIPIKYGKGGIVDVEFLAQALKMKYSNEFPEFKGKNTLELLEACKEKKLGIHNITAIIDGYRFLRTLETHLRLEAGLAVETLSERPREQWELLEEKLGTFISIDGSLESTVEKKMGDTEKSLTQTTI